MNYGSEPADQIVRFTLEGAEVALKLSGLAAKNFALFAYALLKDQKKNRGKTRLVRMLREQRPFKFFKVSAVCMKDFTREAKAHGLLYVPLRSKRQQDEIELVVFADDAAKVSRVLDNLNLDFVGAQAGDAVFTGQKERTPEPAVPVKTETVQTRDGSVVFEVGGFEDDFSVVPGDADGNFTRENFPHGREQDIGEPLAEKNPSAPSSPSKNSSPAPDGSKPSVKKELDDIKKEQAAKAKSISGRSRSKTKKKVKGR